MTQASERLQRCPSVLCTESNGEAILARTSDGSFFGLGETGTMVWARLAQPCTMGEVMEHLGNACGTLPPNAASEVAAFIEELRREGLVEAADAEAAGNQAPQAVEGPPRAYAAPRLDRGKLRHAASGDITFYDGGTTSSGFPGGLS
jgi:hypothetical protein